MTINDSGHKLHVVKKVRHTRLDLELVKRGMVASRSKAKEIVKSGLVMINGKVVTRPATLVGSTDLLFMLPAHGFDYVSRGGRKLEFALKTFGVDVHGLNCLDVGISTGGFTHCLLRHGACKVIGLDVGFGQTHPLVADDPRVILLEGINVRYLQPETLPFLSDLATVDVSFISLSLVLPAVRRCIKPNGKIIALVKPQFEVGPNNLGSGGIVRSSQLRQQAVQRIINVCQSLRLTVLDQCESPVPGGDGNVEFFLYASAHKYERK